MTTVAQILEQMKAHFGEDFEQPEERLQRFLFELERGQMIRMLLPDPDA
jgi:hypothetical protein